MSRIIENKLIRRAAIVAILVLAAAIASRTCDVGDSVVESGQDEVPESGGADPDTFRRVVNRDLRYSSSNSDDDSAEWGGDDDHTSPDHRTMDYGDPRSRIDKPIAGSSTICEVATDLVQEFLDREVGKLSAECQEKVHGCMVGEGCDSSCLEMSFVANVQAMHMTCANAVAVVAECSGAQGEVADAIREMELDEECEEIVDDCVQVGDCAVAEEEGCVDADFVGLVEDADWICGSSGVNLY